MENEKLKMYVSEMLYWSEVIWSCIDVESKEKLIKLFTEEVPFKEVFK